LDLGVYSFDILRRSVKGAIPTYFQASLSAYATALTLLPLPGISAGLDSCLNKQVPPLGKAGDIPDEVTL